MGQFPLRLGPLSRRTKRLLWLSVAAAVTIWIAFFDSHSVVRRVQWHQELVQVRAENERLIQQTTELQAKLEEASSNEVVEQIAREQYGMRKSGETIYRVKPKEKIE